MSRLGCRFMGRLGCRFSAMMMVIIDDHDRRRNGIVFNNHYRGRCGGRCRGYHHRRRTRSGRRHRTMGIRSPCRRYRTHTAAAPDPGAVMPVPILITGYPDTLPPVITIFRDHHHRCRSYHYRCGGYDITLLRRKEYVVKIAEKSVNPTGIFSVINMSSGDMGVITGTSGEEASCQCYR